MPLMRDRQGRLGVSAQGGGSVQVLNQINILNNHPDAEVTAETRSTGNGMQEVIVKVDKALGAMVGRGEGQTFKAFQRNFGQTVTPVSK